MSDATWEPVIGLEVHVQLKTLTKLFCGCAWRFGAPPNTQVCPVCTGQPGALPVLNRAAVELGLRAALALDAEIAPRSRFDRKNYFYCDLPKGYQISQYDHPFCSGGGIDLAEGRHIRLLRIHLEEDAGKAIHDRGEGTLIDLNRAGVPLIEAVSEPDLRTAEEAHAYLSALKEILQYVGASDCDMEKGSLRCDVNVSVRHPGEPLGVKVELKNLNSFSAVRDAIDHEIARQVAGLESGDPTRRPVQETRLWDAEAGASRTMRGKEDAEDYRYFPEPDLPWLTVPAETVEEQRGYLPELPAARRRRYVAGLGLSEYDARVLTASRGTADWFERAVETCGRPKEVANWVANDLTAIASEQDVDGVEGVALRPDDLADLIALVDGGELSRSAARKVLREMASGGRGAREAMRALGLEQVRDAAAIETWVREALVGRERAADDVRAGKLKALGAIVGPVMQASGGRADPELVRATILRVLEVET